MTYIRTCSSSALLCALLLVTLAGCGGAPSEAQRAADSQMALAATVAAAPPRAEATLAPAAILPTAARATAAPPPTAVTTAPASRAPATATTGAQATAIAAASTEIAAATDSALREAPTARPAQAQPTAALATIAPTQVATAAPTAAPAPLPVIACDSPCGISFTELYSGATITGPTLSDKAKALAGKQVIMRGFMAPPLMPSTTFFVLTKDPMVYCPFCNTAADWPFDIVYIKMSGGRNIPTMVPTTNIAVVGHFEVGTWADPDTGFVSLIRIIADSVQAIS